MDAYGQGDYDLAFAEWLPLAETNDLAAQYNIALLLEYGLGVERDLNQAIEWYSRAAESGYARPTPSSGISWPPSRVTTTQF